MMLCDCTLASLFAIWQDDRRTLTTSHRFSLDWPLDAQSDVALFKRIPFQQRILNNPSFCINDDEWTLNSQSSSQWDGLRHFSYLDRRRFYNGATLADFGVPDSHNSAKERTGINDPNGIGSFAQKGIVGRGILLDWERWRVKNGKEDPEVFTDRTQITLDDLKTVIMSQKTNIKFGDILFIRSGKCTRLVLTWTGAYLFSRLCPGV